MKYLTSKQTAENWGVTVRRVQDLCKNGAVVGAVRHGREWLIPEFAEKPVDGRSAGLKKMSQSEDYIDDRAIFNFVSRYNHSGTASSISNSLKDDPVSLDIFKMHFLFYKGEVEESMAIALKYKTEHASVGQRIVIGAQLAICSMCLGRVNDWYAAQEYLKEHKPKNKKEKELLDFFIAANASAAYDGSLFPDWFRRGDFTHLDKQLQPIARFYYVKHIYIISHESTIGTDFSRLAFVRVMPLIIEPLISEAVFDGALINEVYLRLMCASAYHICGEDSLAKRHIKKAVEEMLPDRLYMPLAEYRHRLGKLIDDEVSRLEPKALAEIKRLSKRYNSGWITLHNAVMKRNVSDVLSMRERQISRFAVYGLSNKEISERLGITVNAVKQALRSSMDKTGAKSRTDLYKFV